MQWFYCQIGEPRIQGKYIDAFCGRIPKTILARHYTDYGPERLKRTRAQHFRLLGKFKTNKYVEMRKHFSAA